MSDFNPGPTAASRFRWEYSLQAVGRPAGCWQSRHSERTHPYMSNLRTLRRRAFMRRRLSSRGMSTAEAMVSATSSKDTPHVLGGPFAADSNTAALLPLTKFWIVTNFRGINFRQYTGLLHWQYGMLPICLFQAGDYIRLRGEL